MHHGFPSKEIAPARFRESEKSTVREQEGEMSFRRRERRKTANDVKQSDGTDVSGPSEGAETPSPEPFSYLIMLYIILPVRGDKCSRRQRLRGITWRRRKKISY